MKFTISKSTIQTVTAQVEATLDLPVTVLDSESRPWYQIVADKQGEYVNHNTTLTDDELTVEINDEALIRYVAVYMRIARVVIPFVKPIMALIATVREELDDLESFINQRR